MNNPKPGVVVTLRGDTDFIGVIIHGRKDKCGQISVYWFLWHGAVCRQVVMVEPYKLERFKPRTKA